VPVLLDENLPVGLGAELVGHGATVSGQRWQGIKNGELLRRAQGLFDILITMDRNLEYQQNISKFEVGVLLVRQVVPCPSLPESQAPAGEGEPSGSMVLEPGGQAC
jgi:hypothetical protein